MAFAYDTTDAAEESIQMKQEQPPLYTFEELQSMSEEQLEDICITRGFQLMKDETDPETGEKYQLTHDDYIVAAQKCLAIEVEMNELLNQYPELAEELEEELRQMEAENAAKQAELDKLTKQYEEGSAASESATGTGTGTAFVPNTKPSNNDQQQQQKQQQQQQNEETIEPENVVISDDDLVITDSTDENEDEPATTSMLDEEQEDSVQSSSPQTHDNTTSTDLASNESTRTTEDFTLTHLAIETLRAFVQNAKDDVKRLVGLMIPVVQPLLSAGDVAWRQMKALFVKAQTAYNEYGSTSSSSSSSDTTIEKEGAGTTDETTTKKEDSSSNIEEGYEFDE